jgi:hypothetical protein
VREIVMNGGKEYFGYLAFETFGGEYVFPTIKK